MKPCKHLLVSAFLLLPINATNAADKLPAIDARIDNTSVSGLSSGAFMTSQFFIAYSSIMKGAGIIAGGPYLCAQSWPLNSYIINATTACMNPFTPAVGPNTPLLIEKTVALSESGKIDDIENIKESRIYLFSGKNDKTVTTMVMDQTLNYYKQLGVQDSAILYNKSVNAGHAAITNHLDDSLCKKTTAPYINNCDIYQSKRILNHIYPDLNEPATELSASPIAFDQTEFIDQENTSMSDTGYVYIPEQCQSDNTCSIHVVFHGCEQGAEVIGNKYYTTTGYNEVADANDFIILYPQANPSPKAPYNPKGCWDFWGYTSPLEAKPDYYSKTSPQVSAVYRMVERLAQDRS
ncbi:extracellular catalytic domain type 2 short-chain-length polyhydroxyalkanoate depolymerase [Photobacterium minamisatsumaniensis]|uniref:extracellular catalytic domain type 2 short-chain-length polyhydroxyalkanoate depolymerase n=1 Tax=Photobacterium minamisatsumaniensis TaxID=2910233 RepID=UPI003D0A79EC